jgi:hypothetical protein
MFSPSAAAVTSGGSSGNTDWEPMQKTLPRTAPGLVSLSDEVRNSASTYFAPLFTVFLLAAEQLLILIG